MPSNYPAAYDVFAPHAALMNQEPMHDNVHLLVEQAIVAIQQELGINPSGVQATVAARLNAIETNGGTYATRLGTLEARAIRARLVAAGASYGGFTIQTGRPVVTLNSDGRAAVSFNEGFTTGNVAVVAWNGDSSAVGDVTVGQPEPNNGAGFFIDVRTTANANLVGSFRVEYIAIGPGFI